MKRPTRPHLKTARQAQKRAERQSKRERGVGPGRLHDPEVANRLTSVQAMVDRVCGTSDGERLLKALAVLAMGTSETIEVFFGEPVRVRAKERLIALRRLEERRFGRVAQLDEPGDLDRRPVTIVNVFSNSKDYDFVRDAPIPAGRGRSAGVAGTDRSTARVLGDRVLDADRS